MALLLIAPWLKVIAALPSFFIWLWNLIRRLYTSFWHTLVQRPLAEDSGVAWFGKLSRKQLIPVSTACTNAHWWRCKKTPFFWFQRGQVGGCSVRQFLLHFSFFTS